MKLKRVLLASVVALSFSFSTPAPAKADPVTAFIVTSVAGIAAGTTAAAIATFVVNSALYTAASLAVGKITGALSGKNKQALQERQASVTSLSLGEVPREAVIGLTAVGGSLVDVWNWGGQYGTDNVTRCIALADHAVEDLYGYYVDDVFYPYSGNGVQSGFNGTLTIDFRNATAVGHGPPAYAVANGWEAGDRMTAVTHVWVTTKFDEKVWTQSHPKFRWVLHGLRAFDPRNADVWEDRTTHSFTRNPTLQRYALARGIYAEGRQGQPEHLLIGRGLSAEEAPPERLIAPANLCDESVDGLSRYYADGVISADMDFVTVEQLFADAMAGSIIQHEGGVEVEPGQAKAAVVTITDADLVVGEPVSFSAFLPDSDGGRINTVVPRYVDPAQGYADHSGPVRRDPADLAADGGPRETTLTLPIVTGAAVADRNAEILRRLARLERRATVVLPPWFGWLEEGDWIAWQSDRRHGGATVRYRIEGWTLDEKWRMRLSLREIASSVFGVPDPIEDTAESPPAPVPVDALTLPGATVEAILLPGETSTIPAIRARWDMPVDGAMRAIRGEVRVLGETEVATSRTDDLTLGGGWVFTDGVTPSATLQARLVPIGDPSRPILPSAWFTITTGSLQADISPTSPIWTEIVDQVRDQVAAGLENSDKSEHLAEVVLETILDEQGSLEREAADRLTADTGVLQESKSHTDGKIADTLTIVYTRSQTDQGLASTLQLAKTYTDTLGSSSSLIYSTKTERANGDATTLSSAKSYTDDYKTQANLVFATQVGMGTATAATLSEAISYSDGKLSTALNTVYTKAQTDSGQATTLGEAKSYSDGKAQEAAQTYATKTERANGDAVTLSSARSYIDAFKSEAGQLFAAQSSLNGVSATATLALSTAQDAASKLNEARVRVVAVADGAQPALAEFYSGTAGSSILLSASQIGFVTNGLRKPILTLTDGEAAINGNLVVTGSIRSNAITKGASAASAAETNVGLNTWTNLIQCSMATGGGEVMIDFGAQISAVNTQGPNGTIEVRFVRDGIEIDAMEVMELIGASTVYVQGDGSSPFQTYVQINTVSSSYIHPFTVDIGAGVGAHTWTVQLRSSIGATVAAKKIRLLETKR